MKTVVTKSLVQTLLVAIYFSLISVDAFYIKKLFHYVMSVLESLEPL